MPYHHGDLRRALLHGAIELLAEGGTASLTMRGAAQRAGVSPAAPYRHFTDKRAMMAAVAEEGFLALERACVGAVSGRDADAVEAFWRRGVAYVTFAIENPAHYRVMFGPEIPDKTAYEGLFVAATAAYEALRRSLRACVSAGFFGEDQIELRAMRAWSLVHGLASLYIDGQLSAQGALSKDVFLSQVQAALRLEAEAMEKEGRALPRTSGHAL
jgi:AcrR family transcriptional regulator